MHVIPLYDIDQTPQWIYNWLADIMISIDILRDTSNSEIWNSDEWDKHFISTVYDSLEGTDVIVCWSKPSSHLDIACICCYSKKTVTYMTLKYG